MFQSEKSLLEEIKERRKYVRDIVAFAVLLALFINLLSSEVSEWLNLLYPFWKYFFLILPLLGSVFFLFHYIYGETSERDEFTLLLPLTIEKGEIVIKPVGGYSAPSRAADLFSPVRKNCPEMPALVKNLKDGGLQEGPFRKDMNDLVMALLIKLIRLYGEHTLTTAALYHRGYRAYSLKFENYSKRIEDIQKDSNGNIFLRMQSVKLPKEVDLHIETRESNGIQITSPYCRMKMVVLPYWMFITEDNSVRTYNIVMRNLDGKDVKLLAIPIRVSLRIKRRKLFYRALEGHYMWMRGLLLDSVRWLSVEEYERRDMERLLVEMHENLRNRAVR